eukprot:454866-Pleurochrysis_carterae.AAC.2
MRVLRRKQRYRTVFAERQGSFACQAVLLLRVEVAEASEIIGDTRLPRLAVADVYLPVGHAVDQAHTTKTTRTCICPCQDDCRRLSPATSALPFASHSPDSIDFEKELEDVLLDDRRVRGCSCRMYDEFCTWTKYGFEQHSIVSVHVSQVKVQEMVATKSSGDANEDSSILAFAEYDRLRQLEEGATSLSSPRDRSRSAKSAICKLSPLADDERAWRLYGIVSVNGVEISYMVCPAH